MGETKVGSPPLRNAQGEAVMTDRADERQVGGTHYKDMPVQPWDVMEAVLSRAEFEGFLKGNVIKYSMRAGHKGDASTDLQKARHYLQKLGEIKSR
jgi:hypothetical protein